MLQACESKRRSALPSPPANDAGRSLAPADLAVVTVAHHSEAVLPHLVRDLAPQSRPPARWLLVDNCQNQPPSTPQRLH